MSDTSQKSCYTNSIAGSTSMQMQGLLNEFKLLYQNRLKKLEQQDQPHSAETIQLKIKTLESYVKDLLEQNDVLIQTIDELEKEANSRVNKLENKLVKTSNQLKEITLKSKDFDKEIKSLTGKKESVERELKNKNENIQILQREMDRLKASYEEAVKTLASKTKCDDSIMMNLSLQNDSNLKNIEDSLSSAIKSKNELLQELQDKDKKIVDLQHDLSELKHELLDKENECRDLEDKYASKNSINQKIHSLSKEECKLHRDLMQSELDKEDMKLKLANLNHDISCLLSAFSIAKKTGKFELKTVLLKEVSPDRLSTIFTNDDSTTSSKRVHFADSSNTTEFLKAELQHREDIISSLQQELKSVRSQYETLLNGMTHKDSVINTLKSSLSASSHTNKDFEKEIENRRLKIEINDLKSRIEMLNDDISLKSDENKGCKLELIDLASEVKNLHSELIRKDQQVFNLKDKIHELNLEIANCKRVANGSICTADSYKQRANTTTTTTTTTTTPGSSSTNSQKSALCEEEKTHYENRIQELKKNLDENQHDKQRLVDELNQMQIQYKNGLSCGLEPLKLELRSRDDLIHRLRQEILILQEKRDLVLTEFDSLAAKYSQLECRCFFKEEENANLISRLKQSQKEIIDWKKSFEDQNNRNETHLSKFNMYDETLRTLKEQFNDSQNQNHRLNLNLQDLQESSRSAREKLTEELNKKQDEINRLNLNIARMEAEYQSQLSERLHKIEKVTNELDLSNNKVKHQMEQLDQTTLDLLSYKSKCDDLEKELENFRSQLNLNELTKNSHITTIKSQLTDKELDLSKLQSEINKRSTMIEKLEKELEILKSRHDSAIQEIGRLESRLQSQQFDSKNDNEVLNSEIQKREDQIYRLKIDKENLKEQSLSLEEKLKDYEIVIGNLKQQNVSLQCTIKTKEDQVYIIENQLNDCKCKLKQINDDYLRLEDKYKFNIEDLNNLQHIKEEQEHKLHIKNEVLSQMRNTNEQWEVKVSDLKKQLMVKEDSLQKIASELERIRSISQAKSKECQQKTDLIQKLEDNISDKNCEIDDLRQSSQNDKSQLTEEIKSLEKEYDKLQIQYSQLSETAICTKTDFESVKNENTSLANKLQLFNEDKCRLVEKMQQLENQLVTSMEKHKICQQEVAQRDQTIIKYQSDINLVHEKYASSLDEIKIQQEEIERLNNRIKKQSGDLRDYQSANDRLEDRKEELNKHIKELEYEIEMHKQDLVKQEKTIENIKSEWTSNIRNHEEEIKGYKQNFQILNEELSHTKTDLNDFMNKIAMLKQQVNELSSLLNNKNEENERLCQDLTRFESICKEQDSKICQYLSELSVYRGHYESATNQIALLNNKLDDTENKYEQSLKNIDKLEINLKNYNEQIIELKFKFAEKEQLNETYKTENLNQNQIIQQKQNELKRLTQQNESLNEDLTKVNEDIYMLKQNMIQTESLYKTCQNKLAEKSAEYNDLEDRLGRVQSDLKAHQQRYQYTADEINSRENKIIQLEYEIEETSNQLQLVRLQNQELTSSNSNLKQDFDQLIEQKRNAEKELTRMESVVSELQMNFTSTHQQLKKEINRLESHSINLNTQLQQSEKQIESLTNQIDNLNDNTRKLENQISNSNRELVCKNDEIDRLESNLKLAKDNNLELDKEIRDKENLLADYLNEKEHMKNEANDARHQLQHCLAEKAHIEERFMLINKNLEQIQEEIRQKVTDYVRVEQLCQKQQTEIKTLKDRTKSYEDELAESKKFIEKLKKDLCSGKEDLINAQQECSKFKNNLLKNQHELESKKETEKILQEQLTQNDNLVKQLHGELRSERTKQQECHRHISGLKQNIADLNNEKETNDKQIKELIVKIKERETKLMASQQELDVAQRKIRDIKEEVAEKEGQLKVLSMNLNSSDKQRLYFAEEIQKYEEAVGHFKLGIENSQQQFRDCHADLVQTQHQVSDLKMMISSAESNHRETLGIISEKSKENSNLKNELNNLKQTNESIMDQISQYEEKYKTIKIEFKKIQEETIIQQQQIKSYDMELNNQKNYHKQNEDRIKQLLVEISSKDEQLSLTKTELQSILDKFKQKSEELAKYEMENHSLNQKCQYLIEETKKLETSLDKSRDNGERLHKESEMVIANVNQWVHEQRNNSEKLAIKIREQATAIVHLNTEKEKYIQDIEILQQQLKKASHDLENSAYDKEKIKALQNHLSQQQMLIHQLQNRLKEYDEGGKLIEDLQNRIQLLGQQVNLLQRETHIQREAYEKEKSIRQTLEIQLESKNQFIHSFTAQNSPQNLRRGSVSRSNSPSKQKANRVHDSPEDIGYTSSRSTSLRTPLKEKNNINDETENTDSEFWKQRADELSLQLEQTKRFWSSKVENLQNQLNS